MKGADGKTVLKPKRELRRRVVASIAEVFGADPAADDRPQGRGPPRGRGLAGRHVPILGRRDAGPAARLPEARRRARSRAEGGYALYRKHCLHCHGVSGDGAGPTAAFLWPRPRDYRRGVYKFTSTHRPEAHPRRPPAHHPADGIGNSSMPSFEALMTKPEIEQVIDYVVFLSARGETERRLIDEATHRGRAEGREGRVGHQQGQGPGDRPGRLRRLEGGRDRGPQPADPRAPRPRRVDRQRQEAVPRPGHAQARMRRLPRPAGQGERPELRPLLHVPRGRLRRRPGHAGAIGSTNTWTRSAERAVEDAEPELAKIASPGEREKRAEEIKKATADSLRSTWEKGSLDDWGNPLRPANINNGPSTQYKGGRRPIDFYWRIAKGINGAKMPAHAQLLKPEQIWDLVNFVLALPYDPTLLDDAARRRPDEPPWPRRRPRPRSEADRSDPPVPNRSAAPIARTPRAGELPVVRLWSVLFSLMALAVVGVYVVRPDQGGDWWLPPNVSATSPLRFGADVDHLFVLILWITGITFIGTQIALGYAMWRFAARPGGRASYSHGSQRLEVVWTIIPSAILVFIALYQMGTWSSIKFRTHAAQGQADRRGHGPPVPMAHALRRARRQDEHAGRPAHDQRPALREEHAGGRST